MDSKADPSDLSKLTGRKQLSKQQLSDEWLSHMLEDCESSGDGIRIFWYIFVFRVTGLNFLLKLLLFCDIFYVNY